jgi:hypothetical protein
MSFQIEFFDEVLTDIQEAKEWYKEQRFGLEVEFAFEIEKVLEKIIKRPESFSIRYKNIRIAHPKVFPYNIHFYFDSPLDLIVITGIVHNKRDQNIVRKRL